MCLLIGQVSGAAAALDTCSTPRIIREMSPATRRPGKALWDWAWKRVRGAKPISRAAQQEVNEEVSKSLRDPAWTTGAGAQHHHHISLLDLPTEVRLKIWHHLFTDLIADLTDNLFASFLVYGHMYDVTPSHKQPCQWTSEDHRDAIHTLESLRFYGPKQQLMRFFGVTRFELAMIQHPEFRAAVERANAAAGVASPGSGLTSLLRVNTRVYGEALEALCEHAEFVLTIKGRPDADSDKRNLYTRIDGVGPHLAFATRLKMNLVPNEILSLDESTGLTTIPDTAGTQDRLLARLEAVLEAIAPAGRLRSLEIFIDRSCLLTRDSARLILDMLQERLGARPHKETCTVKIYLGDISEEDITDEQLDKLVSAVNGKSMGRGHKARVPRRQRLGILGRPIMCHWLMHDTVY
ncbi:hypothetical protein M406DRAFT_350246 [Cryphonectria parasitica EP155]|uniref:Uncharacterized protein n=1 Tax=Cryphonectria parasitica (strain ATCC 38755 / EP155) TaxID=660469 RepID=A0A9P5CQ31_CRYP1|nr:uncharacterized protein M406DRAFT_350246 [Cryphonectria parasitica EP155]KAF3766773.1 hypothetical protein M406DRAFT_350246 [Cryphonectria parasitica EP155]